MHCLLCFSPNKNNSETRLARTPTVINFHFGIPVAIKPRMSKLLSIIFYMNIFPEELIIINLKYISPNSDKEM